MNAQLRLGERIVGAGAEPYLIAEIGVNHGCDLAVAKRQIELAHQGGADAVKFQTYKADSLAASESPAYWDLNEEPTDSQRQLFSAFDHFEDSDYKALYDHCKTVGIEFASTPFDINAVELLDPFLSFYKIASADITSLPLLERVASKGKPVVLSTGASNIDEIYRAVRVLKANGVVDVVLLHCVLNYPTAISGAHLNMISHLRALFPDDVIGYSDHVPPDKTMLVLTTAYLKGAQVIEKHFTHDKSLKGNDHYHAMDMEDICVFRRSISCIRQLEGLSRKSALDSERPARLHARRSLVVERALPVGTVIHARDLTFKRPAHGISPELFRSVVGKKTTRELQEDHILQWDDVQCRLGKVVAIVQARMASSRLPGKMLLPLNGRPLLEWVLRRVSLAREVHHVVLATGDDSNDDQLALLADRLGVAVWRGDERNVLKRCADASTYFDATTVVRICADNPLVAPELIDYLVKSFAESDCDYLFNHIPAKHRFYPDGLGGEMLTAKNLRLLLAKDDLTSDDREHVTHYIRRHGEDYDVQCVADSNELQAGDDMLKLDIDTSEDYEKMAHVCRELSPCMSLSQIMPKLREQGDILQGF